ncbi:MAG: YndJ family protein [Opitutaceae bacterium]|nr:YndJ family protein [Opitutaceae bacterium]
MTTPLKVRIGAVAWCVFVYFSVPSLQHNRWAHALLLLAALVLVPMAWCLARDESDTGRVLQLRRLAGRLQLPAALVLIGAFLLPVGLPAFLCALPWVLVIGLMAIVGVLRVVRRPLLPLAQLVRDAGLIFTVVGGVWLLADRAGLRPLGFSPDIVLLTAVHFHFAGLVLPVVTGLVLARHPQSRAAQWSAWGVLVGVPLVAAGISAVQLGWGGAIECLAAVVLVLSAWGVAWQHVRLAVEEKSALRSSRILWAIAAVALAAGMLLAGLYGVRGYLAPLPWLDIPWMRALHGTLNSIGFSLAALLAWCRSGRECSCGH